MNSKKLSIIILTIVFLGLSTAAWIFFSSDFSKKAPLRAKQVWQIDNSDNFSWHKTVASEQTNNKSNLTLV